MRLLTLLLMGVVPGLALSQTVCRPDLLMTHPYDTLQRYSYLVVPILKKNWQHEDIALTDGTGFFIWQNKKLYLISAKHVFTNCDPYGRKTRNDIPDALMIWYQDSLKKPKKKLIPLPANKITESCPAAFDVPDVDALDVTKYLGNEHLNTIESLMPDCRKQNPKTHILSPCDTIVAYGYSLEPTDSNEILRVPNLLPEGYISYSRDMPKDQSPAINAKLFQSYYWIEPGLPNGVSGAPIFRVSFEGTDNPVVEFSGVQSSTKANWKISLIVQVCVLSEIIP